jgi:mRNA interferase HigB
MHVISKPMLISFWQKHPDAESPLQAWYKTMEREVFHDFNSLRKKVFIRAVLTHPEYDRGNWRQKT